MIDRKLPFLAALAALCALPLQAGAQDQDLEDLVKKAAEEQRELETIPQTPTLGPELLSKNIRLPKGERIERLRISQDREIDPQTYIVGPGDVLQLYIWGEVDKSFSLEVDPEGYILIPTIGAFHVVNKTLAAVKEEVESAAQREKYPGIEITLTLMSMRTFTVYLTGAVGREGSFSIQPITRVSDLIERAGGYLDKDQPASRRAIRLTHRDGSSELVDLEMFGATGELSFNPYLRMGDVVHVGFRQAAVYVYGAVNLEGAKEFRPGDSVGTLLTLAGHLSGNAPVEEVELWRFRPDGKTSDIIPLFAQEQSTSAAPVLASLGEMPLVESGPTRREEVLASISGFPLQPQDMLFIRTRSDWRQSPTVHILGQVLYHGRYRIRMGQTRIRDIIEEAGGLSDRASLSQAKLIRVKYRNTTDPEFERLLALQSTSGLSDMSPQDRGYLKTKSREERGRVAVDFERLIEENDESQNILLEGGDVIFIPEKRQTISLTGQVEKPGLIKFEEGRHLGYYLAKAGGLTWNADKKRARLIRARTGLRVKLNKDFIVEAGDEIWVPEKEYRNWWRLTQSTMRTIAETLTLVVLVRAF